MFARCCQENFFKYTREHFGLDRLIDYQVEDITDPIQVVNPKHRDLDGQVRSAVGKLSRLQAKFGAMTLASTDRQQTTPFINKKTALLEDIEIRQKAVDELKDQRKATSKHITSKIYPKRINSHVLAPKGKDLSTPLR